MPQIMVLRAPISTGDTSKPLLSSLRDPLLVEDSGGVRFDMDLESLSYASASDPVTDTVIGDISGNGNGIIRGAQNIDRVGNGFAFNNISAAGNYIEIPASVAADLWASQNFLIGLYVRLPASADWIAPVSGDAPFLSWTESANSYTTAELIRIAMTNYASTKRINFSRQTASGAVTDVASVPDAGDYGSVVQLRYWRNSSGIGYGLRSANGVVQATAARGTDNSFNFSALTGKLGVGKEGWPAVFSGGSGVTSKFRIYRCFIENLQTSGRDPQAVLDEDYSRVMTRGAFS